MLLGTAHNLSSHYFARELQPMSTCCLNRLVVLDLYKAVVNMPTEGWRGRFPLILEIFE